MPKPKIYPLLCAFALLAAIPTAPAQTGLGNLFEQKPKFLPVHEAFSVSTENDGGGVRVRFRVADKHYIYQDRLRIALPDGVTASDWKFDKTPTVVDDPIFGKVAVFEEDVSARLSLSNTSDSPIDADAQITWQGCAKAGLCYPPETIRLRVHLESAKPKRAPIGDAFDQKIQSAAAIKPTQTDDRSAQTPQTSPTKRVDEAQDTTSDSAPPPSDADDTRARYTLDHRADGPPSDAFGINKNPPLAVFLLFFAGVVLAFSACVYPMLPIVANIVAGSKNPSTAKGLFLTLAYGLGVATSYGILGAAVAYFGRSLGVLGWLQNPWVLSAFALTFVLLALKNMGLVAFGLPSALKNRFLQGSQAADRYLGNVGGSFLAGTLSALVVSPCVSAPLAGALLAVAASENAALGFVALFALGLGLSAPLVVFGAAGGKYMPKTGAWMDKIKFVGGLMLLFLALLLLSRVFVGAWMLLLWGLWFAVVGLFLWETKRLFLRGLGFVSLAWAIALVLGASKANVDPWRPLVTPTENQNQANDAYATTLAELDDLLKSNPKVVVKITADWCLECHIMERELFENRPQTMQDWLLVRLDVGSAGEDSRQILTRYKLFGPPALLYYKEGKLQQIQVGAVHRRDFENALF